MSEGEFSGALRSTAIGLTATGGQVTMDAASRETASRQIPSFTNSMVIECAREYCPFFRSDIANALRPYVDPTAIVAMGNLRFNWKWTVTFKTEETRNRLMEVKNLLVKGQPVRTSFIRDQETQGKIFWLPYEIENADIIQKFEQYGKITFMRQDKCIEMGLEHVFTNVRRFRIALKEGIKKEDLPHLLHIFGFEALVVVQNREPVCLRCKRSGHIRRNCEAEYCLTCRGFEHTKKNCSVNRDKVTEEMEIVEVPERGEENGKNYENKAGKWQLVKEGAVPDKHADMGKQQGMETKNQFQVLEGIEDGTNSESRRLSGPERRGKRQNPTPNVTKGKQRNVGEGIERKEQAEESVVEGGKQEKESSCEEEEVDDEAGPFLMEGHGMYVDLTEDFELVTSGGKARGDEAGTWQELINRVESYEYQAAGWEINIWNKTVAMENRLKKEKEEIKRQEEAEIKRQKEEEMNRKQGVRPNVVKAQQRHEQIQRENRKMEL